VSRTNRTEPQTAALRPLRTVEPERLARPAHTAIVWGSLLLVWLVSLLPWRLWPQAPDVLLLVIAFWCVHEPRRVGMVTAFIFGLLMDVHDAGVLGEHALGYTLVAYGAVVLHRRLQRFDLWSQAMHMLPLFFLARLLTVVIHAWIAGKWPGWAWATGTVLTAAIWPLAGWVLHLPQNGADDLESKSV
jgi:rod shape-determining protein MreD